MADLDLTNFQGFLDYEGLDYFKEKNDDLTDEKIAVETDRATLAESNLDSKKVDKTTVATSSTLGLVKSGTDITVDSNGNVSVNDNSHKHTVSNISDLTATASELNTLDGITATVTELNYVDGVTSNIQTQLNVKAPLASPTLTGTPKAPTASAGTNTTQIATTAFVTNAVTTVKNDLLNGAGAAYDTLKELGDLIDDNADAIDALETVASSKANTTDLTSHTGNTTVHITSTERTNWNTAYSNNHTHSNKTVLDNTTASYTTAEKTKLSGIATGAEVNQNAFGNIVVGSTTIAADTKTDSLTLVGSNVTLTPDATNDKVTIGITKENIESALGYTPPTADTNTHYTSKNVVGSSTATSNTTSALTNGNVYLNSVENGAVTSTHKISGSGATTVTTDASGNIVISSTDTNTNTVTTVSTTGSGNAITSLSASNGAITATKGSTFLTAHPTISTSTDTTSTATATHGGTVTMVDSITRDSNGHVTKVNTKTVTLPSDNNTVYTHPSYTARTGKPTANQTPAFGGTATVSQITSDATGHITDATDRTITIPSTLSNGTGTAGLIKTTSTVTSNSGYTACPVISGVPYYKATSYTHPTSGVTAGTYRSVTVDANGHVTAGSNPTTTVAQGGTGLATLTSGYALIGNGTSAVSLRAITDTPSSASTSLFTAGGAYTQLATKLNTSAVTTSLASTSTTNALAASAGKDLQDQITALNSDLTQKTLGQFTLSNGLKICWGQSSTTNLNNYWRKAIIIFPIEYSSTPTVIATKKISSNLTNIETKTTVGIGACDTIYCNIYVGENTESIGNDDIILNWISIGY